MWAIGNVYAILIPQIIENIHRHIWVFPSDKCHVTKQHLPKAINTYVALGKKKKNKHKMFIFWNRIYKKLKMSAWSICHCTRSLEHTCCVEVKEIYTRLRCAWENCMCTSDIWYHDKKKRWQCLQVNHRKIIILCQSQGKLFTLSCESKWFSCC